MEIIMNTPAVSCCFCDKNIESTNVNPCDINILTNWDKPKNKQHNQTFWCHIECLRDKLHKSVQQHLIVDLLTDDSE